jgi:hypothetical protein
VRSGSLNSGRNGSSAVSTRVEPPAECAVLGPARADYLRTQIEHRLGFRAAPVCT